MGIREDEVDSLPGTAVEACSNCRHSHEVGPDEFVCQWFERLPATLEAIMGYMDNWKPVEVDGDHVCEEFEE